MCAQFKLKILAKEFASNFGIRLNEGLVEINERFLPSQLAPVIVFDKSCLRLIGMQFGLIPAWSKDPKVRFATHNARLETVIEKPTWRIPFETRHCVIPLTAFYESVYEGLYAGNIIEFSSVVESKVLFAAGIFDVWKNQSKNLFSFSILTTTPTDFIAASGHDRSPLFLDHTQIYSWLTLKDKPEKMQEFLIKQNYKPELNVVIDRPLKSGWQKKKTK